MNETLGIRTLRWIAILGIIVWSLGPIVLGVMTSISSQVDVRAVPTRWVPHTITLAGYRQLLEGTSSQHSGGTVTEAGVFSKAMETSAEVALATTFVTLIVSTMAAYAFGRLRFVFGRALFYATLTTMIVPIFVVVVALFQVMARLHLIDTKRGLVMVFVATLVAACNLAFVQPCARDGDRTRGGRADRRLSPMAGVHARGGAADELGDRRRGGDPGAVGVGRVPDPAPAHLDLELQAGDGADHASTWASTRPTTHCWPPPACSRCCRPR